MGLSCGNPHLAAAVKPGETVLDLGCGAGFDCFIAAKYVQEAGQVIGVDMTPEMIHKARLNLNNTVYKNIEFRLGEIEHLPVADQQIDLVISNCVINLCEDKKQVFKEIRRVLNNDGRFVISDTIILNDFTPKEKSKLQELKDIYKRFITLEQYQLLLDEVGITNATVAVKGASCFTPESNDPIAQTMYQKLGADWNASERFSTVLVTGKR